MADLFQFKNTEVILGNRLSCNCGDDEKDKINKAFAEIATANKDLAEYQYLKRSAIECDICGSLFIPGGKSCEATCSTCLKEALSLHQTECADLKKAIGGISVKSAVGKKDGSIYLTAVVSYLAHKIIAEYQC